MLRIRLCKPPTQEGIDKKSRNRIQVVPVDQSLKWTEANVRLAPHPARKCTAARCGSLQNEAEGSAKPPTMTKIIRASRSTSSR